MGTFRLAFLLAIIGYGGTALALEPPVLRVGLESEPTTLDWNAYQSSSDRFLISFLMRGLLKYDGAGKIVCDLCRTYQVAADGKSMSFQLNPEESWSDGVPLEATHFVDSLKRLQDSKNHFKAAANFRELVSAKAEGKATLVLQLSSPSNLVLHYLTTIAAFPLRKELGPNQAQAAVLGPYQLAEWKKGKSLVIEGNPTFKGQRPVYRVVFSFGQHGELLSAFQKGKIDILTGPTTEDLLKAPGQRVQVSPYWATRNLILNIKRPTVSNAALRRAILYSLDRETLPSFLKNGERKVTGLISPGLPGYRELPLVTADPARAAQELGRLPAALKEKELILLVPEGQTERRAAEWISEKLKKAGLKTKVSAKNGPDYLRARGAGQFDLALSTWTFGIASSLEILGSFRTGSPSNFGGWTSVAFDSLWERIVREQDQAQGAQALDQATQLLETQEVAVIPLGYPTQPFLLGSRVDSFAVTPFGDPDLVKIQLKQ